MEQAPGGFDLDQVRGLRAFVAAAQRLSFTRAAAELGVSPQAVAAAVARLERSLGVRLLNRSSRSMSMTPEGALLLPRAADALERLRDAAASAAHGDTPAGPVRVSVAAAFARRFVLPELPRLLERFPSLGVELSLEDRRVDVIREGFDVAIRGGAAVDPGLVGRRFATIRMVLVAHPRYLHRAGVPRRPEDLASHRRIGLRFLSGAMQPWTFVDRGDAPPPSDPLVVSDPEAAVHAAELGLGIAAVGAHHAMPALRAGRLKVVLPDAFRPAPRELSIQYPHRDRVAPRVRAVVDHLLAAWAKHPDLHATAADLKRHAA